MDNIPLSVLFLSLFILLLLSAFFSGSETGLMTLNRYRLRHAARKGNRAARMVENLLENAIKFSPAGGEVAVRLGVERVTAPLGGDGAGDGGRAVVEVADQGPGIPEEERRRVFERFVQLEAQPRGGNGDSGHGAVAAGNVAVRVLPSPWPGLVMASTFQSFSFSRCSTWVRRIL